MENNGILRRYTNLPVLIDVLTRRRLTLISYTHWIDVNDRRALQLYQQVLKYGFVGAMCLTEAPETFHHWQIFAGGPAGVSIIFHRDAFENLFRDRPHFIAKSVEYVRLASIRSVEASDIHRLPFLKRSGFADEREFRLIGYAVEALTELNIEIASNLIQRVVISPFAHPNLIESIRTTLRSIPGWSRLQIDHSSLINNESWQEALQEYVSRHGGFYGPWMDFDA